MENILAFTIKRSWVAQLLLFLFIALTGWWLTIYVRGLTEGTENNAYTLIYPLLALIGSISGLVVSKRWGGFKSVIGKGLSLLTLGLFAQFFGQAAYAYNIYIKGTPVEELYPSLGDLGYFGSVIFYFFSLIFIARVAGVRLSLSSYKGQLQAIIIPILLLVFSYTLFLRGYVMDWEAPIVTFLDLAYPIGQAIYISVAIVIYALSKKFLGGAMKGPILFLLVALLVQYISDSTFLYQVKTEQWYVGGINDYMYTLSYVLMAIGLIQIGKSLDRVKEL